MLSHLLNVMAVAGTNTVAVLAFGFWNRPLRLATIAGYVSVPLAYSAIVYTARVWRNQHRPAHRALQFVRRYNILTACLGVSWTSLLVGLASVANPPERSLLFSIEVAAISTPVLVAPASAALAFWLPVTIGAFASVSNLDWPLNLITSVCLFGYAALTLMCLLYLNKNFIDRVLNEITLKDQSDVIRLLLRDFEESSSDWLWETDDELRLNHVSARLAEVSLTTVERLRGRSMLKLLTRASPGKGDNEALLTLTHRLADRAPFRDLVIPLMVGRQERWWSLTGKPM
ncbi:MAG: hypothetical protein JO212_02340, partial [Acetobacteraceae bacterium]|nr:hypothetical protein [Acetobacteraceae bacterium]